MEPTEQEIRTITLTQPVPTPMGMMPMPVETTVYDVTFKRTCKYGEICVEPVPPEQYRVSGDCRSLDPCNARMVGQERDDVTRTELIEMGLIRHRGQSAGAFRYQRLSSQEDGALRQVR
jgi:hypothetical protein